MKQLRIGIPELFGTEAKAPNEHAEKQDPQCRGAETLQISRIYARQERKWCIYTAYTAKLWARQRRS